ncbi:MAG: response regulator [Alphaproteobacteria bacterium]|nr:response regulator [Alphaproteobacteria bacterium]
MPTHPTRFASGGRTIPIMMGLLAMLLVAIGIGVIFQNEANYREQKTRETNVQAEILAASVTAALDFQDAPTARESVDALRVNPQILAAGIYGKDGALFAGYERRPRSLPNRALAWPAAGDNMVLAVYPIVRSGERIGTVYLLSQREPLKRRITRYGIVALLLLLAAMIVTALGVAHNLLRRSNRALGERAEALSDAYAELQVQVEERARAEEQLRQAQKMQALGQLTGGIAHDFNNLLTVIQGSADILRRPDVDDAKRIRFAEAIVQTTGRAAALTAQLLAFSRRQPLKPQVIDLNRKIRAMTELLDRTLGERVEVVSDLAANPCRIEADPAQLEAAILNVAVNARDAMPGGGKLTIRTGSASLGEDKPAMALAFADTGSGIGEEDLARVFEPFFTTKAVGKGTGLGLSQVYGFAAQSGGDVRVDSRLGEGTTVTILLPCNLHGHEEAEEEIEARPVIVSRSGRILVVDDNEEVGMFAEILLQELGYEVRRATSGSEALELAQSERFDLVFTDVVMPGMSGLQLAEALDRARPGLPIILTTGFSDEVTRSGSGGRPVVFKPYRLEALTEAIDKALPRKV